MKKIIIAIDGHSSCGKSTLAKALAKKLHYAYGDSGAMYRAVTLYFIDRHLDYNDASQVELALKNINIHFERLKGQNHTFLNDEDVELRIREMRVNDHVSEVAAISSVRSAMVEQQKRMGQRKGIVMDGRDIGTVVFPNAELKIFLTAETEVRTSRRHLELAEKGIDADWESVKKNLEKRDKIDSSREDSPLRKAEHAIVLDNTHLTEQEQLEKVLHWVSELIHKDDIYQ